MASSIPDATLLSGPLLLGFMFTYGLFGVLCEQVFVYHISFPNDSRWIKAYITLVFSIEIVLVVVTSYTAWCSLGSGFGDFSRLIVFDRSTIAQPPLTGLATLLFHGFYCWRIAKITQNLILPIIVALISVLQFALTIYVGVYLGLNGHEVTRLHNIDAVIMTWIGGAAAADLLISVVMVTILCKYRTKSTCAPTKTTLHRLINFAVETGMISTCMAILDCVFFLCSQHTYLYMIIFYALAKVYSNTTMATLNSRISFNRNKSNFECGIDGHADSAFWCDQGTHVTTLQFASRGGVPNTEDSGDDTEMNLSDASKTQLPRGGEICTDIDATG